MKDIKEINTKELVKAIEDFNSLEIMDPIKVPKRITDKTKTKLRDSFVEAIETLTEDEEGLLPDNVILMYNSIVEDEVAGEDVNEDAGDEVVVLKEEEEGDVASSPEDVTKTKKPKAGETPTKGTNKGGKGKNIFGRRVNSRYGKLDDMLLQGASYDEMVAMLVNDFGVDEKRALSTIKGHIRDVRKRGQAIIEEKDGKVYFRLP